MRLQSFYLKILSLFICFTQVVSAQNNRDSIIKRTLDKFLIDSVGAFNSDDRAFIFDITLAHNQVARIEFSNIGLESSTIDKFVITDKLSKHFFNMDFGNNLAVEDSCIVVVPFFLFNYTEKNEPANPSNIIRALQHLGVFISDITKRQMRLEQIDPVIMRLYPKEY